MAGRKRLSTERAFGEIRRLLGQEYEVMSDEFPGVDVPVLIIHLRCGTEYRITLSDLRKGRKCPHCAKSKASKYGSDARRGKIGTAMHLVERSGEYELVGRRYENVHLKMLVRHRACGMVYLCTVNNFRIGRRCPNCKKAGRPPVAKAEAIIIEDKAVVRRRLDLFRINDW